MASKGCHTQSGRVASISEQSICIVFETQSACGGCAARSKCGMSESSEREINIPICGNEDLKIGDSVTIAISSEMGVMSVVVAYIVPLIILMAGLMLSIEVANLLEWQGALISLLCVAVYYIGIYIFRDKLENKIKFKINK